MYLRVEEVADRSLTVVEEVNRSSQVEGAVDRSQVEEGVSRHSRLSPYCFELFDVSGRF